MIGGNQTSESDDIIMDDPGNKTTIEGNAGTQETAKGSVSPLTLIRTPSTDSPSRNSPPWQIAHSRKRARTTTSLDSDDNTPTTPTRNRYSSLSIDNDRNPNQNKQDNNSANDESSREPKPLPIFIPGVVSIVVLKAKLEQEMRSNDYTHKKIGNTGQLKMMAKNTETFRKIIRILDNDNAFYHTYQLKQMQAYRVVIRSLHPTTPI